MTRHNFDEVLPAVRAALADCQFFALDCEMTGLHVRDQRFSFHADMQDQYSTVTHWPRKCSAQLQNLVHLSRSPCVRKAR